MTRKEFKLRFISSIKESIMMAKRIVIDDLPDKAVINLYSRDKKKINLRLNIDDAVKELYLDGKIPKWINITAVKIDGMYTIIECDYSDIFLDDDRLLQFPGEPLSPFKASGPYLPPNWKSLEESGKFHLLKYEEETGRAKIDN